MYTLVLEDSIDVSAVFWTRKAKQRLNSIDVMTALVRHFAGDWGHMAPSDWLVNDESLNHGGPVMSSHIDRHREKFLILTDQGLVTTTVLLPDEY